MPETYTVKQVADILGYSTNSIYTFLKEGRILGIRVGKGRFRISQGEVDRLLQSRPKEPDKGQTVEVLTAEPEKSGKVALMLPSQPVDIHIDRYLFPSFFDWFVTIASIVLGTSLVLFSRDLEDIGADRFLLWFMPIQICFIAGGIGYLLSRVLKKNSIAWKILFAAILIFAYWAFTVLLALSGQWGLTYGLVGLVVLVSLFVNRSSAVWIVLLDSLFSLSYAFAFVLFPTLLPPGLEEAAMSIGSSLFVRAIPLVGIVVLTILTVISFRRYPKAFMVISGVKAFGYIALSLLLASESHWGRSLLWAVFSVFILFLPKGATISPIGKQERIRAYACFGLTLCLFLLGIGMIRLMQLNTYEYTQKELINKVSYGKTVVESTVESVQRALVFQSKDPEFVQAVQQEDAKTLEAAERTTFEVNRSLRRLLVLNAQARGIAYYPLIATSSASYASEEYFTQVRSKGKPYVNYISLEGYTEPRSIVISVPVVTSKQEFIGALIGTLDMGILANTLQSFFSPEVIASVVLVDSGGVRIITADPSFIDHELDPDDPVRLGLVGQHGVAQGYSTQGRRTLTAYDAIPSRGWAIGAKQSLNTVFGATRGGIVTILFVVGLSIGVFIFLLADYQSHPHLEEVQGKAREDTS